MFADPSGDRINCFAVVSYIPEPLAGFLDSLRQELVPNCFLRAHITILPPRPASIAAEQAWHELSAVIPRFEPFEIELSGVEVFPLSDVIYVAVGKGQRELCEMYEAMNVGGLSYKEIYSYHPHVTLAQNLRLDELDELIRVARERWTEMAHGRSFRVDTLTFVQNNRRKEWVDLAQCRLSQPCPTEEPQATL